MHPSLVRALAAAGLALWTALPARAQLLPGAPRADSAREARSARSAQAEFERRRFGSLPWTDDHGGGCDERIGRFCVWFDPAEREWKPPPEPPAVTRARDALLERLAQAAARVPGDGWVAGQRVRYLAQAGRMDEAAAAARACRAEGWWCRALEGYALHAGGRYDDAERAFAGALAAMPERERREWDDLSPILDDGDARALRRLPPAERARLERRLWWLADPFWMEPGSDRRTEHLARLVADRWEDRARNPEGLSWGGDLRELLLRYGVAAGWERVRERPGSVDRPSVVTHHPPMSWRFDPTLAMLRDPAKIDTAAWRAFAIDARTTYGPRYLAALEPLAHQLAVFRRDGRALVVAAFEMARDSLPASPRVDAALVLARDEEAEPRMARATLTGGWGVLRLAAPAEPSVVSVEAIERETKRGARARLGVDPRRPESGGLSISDILLMKDAESPPSTLDEAVARARGDVRVRPGERLGLFWEVYGLEGGDDTLTFSVSLARTEVGALRRAAERLGVSAGMAPVRVRWREQPGGAAILPRSTAVALPQVPPGEYLLEITARSGARQVAATRRIRVER